MNGETTISSTASPNLRALPVYLFAALCLVFGFAIGFVLRGPQVSSPHSHVTSTASAPGFQGRAPNPAELKQMADAKAGPLLEALKSNPNDPALLAHVGAIYHAANLFHESAAFYGRAVQMRPKDVALRTKFASSLYRGGDVDGAIAQLKQALHDQPNDANSLFNLGLIQWQGKHDRNGALASWHRLLTTNPQLSAGRKAEVRKLMDDAMNTPGNRQQGSSTTKRQQ